MSNPNELPMFGAIRFERTLDWSQSKVSEELFCRRNSAIKWETIIEGRQEITVSEEKLLLKETETGWL